MARTTGRRPDMQSPRRLRSHVGFVEETNGSSEREWTTANSSGAAPRRSTRARLERPSRSTPSNARTQSSTVTRQQSSISTDNPVLPLGLSSQTRGSRRIMNSRTRRPRGHSVDLNTSRSLAGTSRRRGNSENDGDWHPSVNYSMPGEDSSVESQEQSEYEALFGMRPNGDTDLPGQPWWWNESSFASERSRPSRSDLDANELPSMRSIMDDDPFAHMGVEDDDHNPYMVAPHVLTGQSAMGDGWLRHGTGAIKRSRDKFENPEGMDAQRTLSSRGAISVFLYHSEIADREANDIWPNFRSAVKLPARYYALSEDSRLNADGKGAWSNLRHLWEVLYPAQSLRNIGSFHDGGTSTDDLTQNLSSGWPAGQVPTELFEEIASYLNRDDIKSMRLVCREFDRYLSQVLFKTVVVPFNTEIYGMIGKEKPDLKGKNKVRVEKKTLSWKNANGDDVYNGHGLDVFRGFGQHILKFGMSFEVSEDSLARPPAKNMTERHTSFWGSYNWPFEEYRRFDDVAGLESAADETPRMTVAFSELVKVRELAISIDSGLGWLNGPDRSIRARILQRPPEVFGTLKKLPDRRAQAQKELWDLIESRHETANCDVKTATLYKLDISRMLTELKVVPTIMQEQPEMPYLDSHIIHEAIPHDTADIQVPSSFDDPEVLDRFIMTPSGPGTGILFTSATPPTDACQLVSPIIPANLTKAQKEWLLETEWAQRAFLSSYMLSIIDNPATFKLIYTLNVSQLSDRYISMLNRQDFWDALPSLRNVTLQVIPGWRTVGKDEAGYVDTPKVSPSSGIDPIYDLLRNVISHRQNIEQVTIGWTTGGEHAEGVHARNKLLLPAPLLPADHVTGHDAATFTNLLLQLPYVEDLTIKNCWISPEVLVQFVKQHDRFRLKNLTLDSVSLTAVLRHAGNVQNPNHAQGAVGFMMAPGAAAQGVHAPQAPGPGHQAAQLAGQAQQNNAQHLFHAIQTQFQQLQGQQGAHGHPQLAQIPAQNHQAQVQQQLLAWQVQAHQQQVQLHTLQQQHQQQALQQQNQQHALQQLQQQIHGFAFMTAHAQNQALAAMQQHQQPHTNMPTPNLQAGLRAQPREGSWMHVLDITSPGINLTDFSSEFSQADAERKTSLECIKLISCGYAKLPYASFEQNVFFVTHPVRNPLFIRKFNTLAPAMLSGKWPLLGEIVQEVNFEEVIVLNAGWDLESGWQDAEAARGPEFDGMLPGGTCRFTGEVRKRLVDASGDEQL